MNQIDQLIKMRWILFWVITSLFVLVVAATLGIMFLGGGNLNGQERSILFNSFIVEIGVAVFALFYSIFGLRKHAKKSNILDREGFKTLISLHFQSVTAGLMQLFDDIHLQNHDEANPTAQSLLINNVKSVLHEARDKLTIYSVDGIPDINAFLETNLPSEKLDELVREAVSVALAPGESEEQRKRAVQYIKHVQVGLLKDINNRIINEVKL